MKDKEYYYLDTINFELLGQKTDKTINLNSGVYEEMYQIALKKLKDSYTRFK